MIDLIKYAANKIVTIKIIPNVLNNSISKSNNSFFILFPDDDIIATPLITFKDLTGRATFNLRFLKSSIVTNLEVFPFRAFFIEIIWNLIQQNQIGFHF